MKKKLRNILLIDDNEADNFIHNRVIEKADVAEIVTITYGAQEALDYLCEKGGANYPKPEIVFLDINMPGMTGWDFLAAYQKLDEDKKAGIVICLLSTSSFERDKQKAEEYNVLSDFTNKPLTHKKLMEIIETHFPEYI